MKKSKDFKELLETHKKKDLNLGSKVSTKGRSRKEKKTKLLAVRTVKNKDKICVIFRSENGKINFVNGVSGKQWWKSAWAMKNIR